jgi:2-keto-4-pentenoate hydratase
MRDQVASRRRTLDAGARPLGWKVGFNIPEIQERLGIDRPVAGYLSTAGFVEAGGTWPIAGGERVAAEPEVAVEIAPDGGSIAALLPALEIVDPPDLDLPLERILARNVFHRGVVFGPRVEVEAPGAARVARNGEQLEAVAAERTAAPLEAMVEVIGSRVADAGERLQPGDRIITGAITPPLPVVPGERVRLELENLGSVELSFGALE